MSLDVGYDASGTWGWPFLNSHRDTDESMNPLLVLLGHVDVFLPNEVEASGISGCGDDDKAALEWLSKRVRLDGAVVLTLGARGALVQTNRIEKTAHENVERESRQAVSSTTKINTPDEYPAPVIPKLIDPTGAGDAFNAAFLFRWAIEDKPLQEAVKYGLLGGSSAVMHAGACEQLLTTALLEATSST